MKWFILVCLSSFVCTIGCASNKNNSTATSNSSDVPTLVDSIPQTNNDVTDGKTQDEVTTKKDIVAGADTDTTISTPDTSDTMDETVSPMADAIQTMDVVDTVQLADVPVGFDVNKDDISTSSKQKCLCYPDGTFCPWKWIVAPWGQDLYDPSMKCPEGEICNGGNSEAWNSGYNKYLQIGFVGICERRCTRVQGKIETMTDDLCGHGEHCVKIYINAALPEDHVVKVDAVCVKR